MTAEEFKQLFLPQARRMYGVAWRLTQNAADAEDLVQDTLLRLFERRADLSAPTNAAAYAAQAVYRLFVSQQRAHTDESALLDAADAVADSASPLASLTARELRERWRALANALPDGQRRVYVLHDVCGLSADEIGAQTGLAAANVRMLLSRARRKIRENLQDEL